MMRATREQQRIKESSRGQKRAAESLEESGSRAAGAQNINSVLD